MWLIATDKSLELKIRGYIRSASHRSSFPTMQHWALHTEN